LIVDITIGCVMVSESGDASAGEPLPADLSLDPDRSRKA